MQRIRKTSIAVLATTAAIAAIAAAPAVATPIVGTAIDPNGDPIASGDGWYDFYIPLDGVEDYDGSLVRDYCRTDRANECLGGTLNMKMHFAADWTGQTTVSFDFDDLDIDGFNDTNHFFEVLGLAVEDSGGTVLSLSQSEVAGLLTGNRNAQQLVFDFNATGEFYVHLTFGTQFNDPPGRRYRNTLESIYGGAVSTVPEPGTLALLGAGLLFLAFSQRRKRLSRIVVRDE